MDWSFHGQYCDVNHLGNFEQTLGDSEGQESLAHCSPWSHKELDMTERLNNTNEPSTLLVVTSLPHLPPVPFIVLWATGCPPAGCWSQGARLWSQTAHIDSQLSPPHCVDHFRWTPTLCVSQLPRHSMEMIRMHSHPKALVWII